MLNFIHSIYCTWAVQSLAFGLNYPSKPCTYYISTMFNERNRNTYDLQFGHIFLPPQVFLVLRTHGRQHVIRVHANVHEVIQDIRECCVSTCKMPTKKKTPAKHAMQDERRSEWITINSSYTYNQYKLLFCIGHFSLHLNFFLKFLLANRTNPNENETKSILSAELFYITW